MWFLDSAYKTTQAMKDFNREELSLMIFGNKRGFSGEMKGMEIFLLLIFSSFVIYYKYMYIALLALFIVLLIKTKNACFPSINDMIYMQILIQCIINNSSDID